jgi:hypothetical protein
MKWKMNKNEMEKRVLMCQLFSGRDTDKEDCPKGNPLFILSLSDIKDG